MATVLTRPRVDERAIGAGTTVRFVLLVVLLLVASGSMMLDVITGLFGSGSIGCLLAAGVDPDGETLGTSLVLVAQPNAFHACAARYNPPPPQWVIDAWPVLLLVVASVLFFGVSGWKARRGRVVPLEAIDHDGDLRDRLRAVTAAAGLARAPRFVVDPAAASTGAVVFGRNRRPTVCLHGGLLVRERTDPEGFRAVLLHELAHIRNGDVTITYATVAVWRAFLAVVLVPYAAWQIKSFVGWLRSPIWSSDAPVLTRSLLLIAVMVVLVYLARSDVLRSREIYADLAAVRWGADPHGWAVTTPALDGNRLRRVLGSFVELWRTHPRWDLRREALADPSALFGVRALPMFLTGAVAILINSQMESYLGQYNWGGPWVDQVRALVAAGLVTGVAGIALWRAVAHAVLTSRRVPSGVRAGLGLGAGMTVGELVTNRVQVTEWLPPHPEVLLLVVLAGAVFAWWVTQCAHLWVRTWRGRTILPAMLLGLAAAGLGLYAWFAWWQSDGVDYAEGWPFSTSGIRDMLLQALPASAADHSAMLTVIAVTYPVLSDLSTPSFVLAAVAAWWIVPMLAWTIRPATTTPRWARAALRDTSDGEQPLWEEALPPLRRVLLPGLVGGVVCWAAVAGVQAYAHTWRPLYPQQTAFALLVYLGWVLVALLATAVTTSVVASVLAGRYRLLLTLIATETAALVGFAGMLVLVSVDGCIPPLRTFWSSCEWHTALTQPVLTFVLVPTFVLAAIAAIVAASVVSMIRTVRRRAVRQSAPARPSGTRRYGLAARRLYVAVLAVAATGIAVPGVMLWVRENPLGSAGNASLDGIQAAASRVFKSADGRPVSANTRAVQVYAWYRYGGADLDHRLGDAERRLGEAERKAANSTIVIVDPSSFLPICASIGQIARDAGAYFRIPDPQAQALWLTFITQAGQGSKDCEQALQHALNLSNDVSPDQQHTDLFYKSLDEIEKAGATYNSILARINVVVDGRPKP